MTDTPIRVTGHASAEEVAVVLAALSRVTPGAPATTRPPDGYRAWRDGRRRALARRDARLETGSAMTAG